MFNISHEENIKLYFCEIGFSHWFASKSSKAVIQSCLFGTEYALGFFSHAQTILPPLKYHNKSSAKI